MKEVQEVVLGGSAQPPSLVSYSHSLAADVDKVQRAGDQAEPRLSAKTLAAWLADEEMLGSKWEELQQNGQLEAEKSAFLFRKSKHGQLKELSVLTARSLPMSRQGELLQQREADRAGLPCWSSSVLKARESFECHFAQVAKLKASIEKCRGCGEKKRQNLLAVDMLGPSARLSDQEAKRNLETF